MAIIRTAKYLVNVPLLTEDPYPSSVNMYIQNDAYNKYTLDHYFDRTIYWDTTGATYGTFGGGAYQYDQFLSGALVLKGETTHVRHRIFNTNNDYRNNLDQAPFASMDPARPIQAARYDTDGTNNQSFFTFNYNYTNMVAFGINYARRVNAPTDSANIAPVQNSTFTVAYSGFPVYRNPATNNLVFVTNNHTTSYQPGFVQGSAITNLFGSGTPTFNVVGAGSGTATNQFLGTSADGYAMFLNNQIGNDFTQNVYKYNDGSNTATNPFTVSTAPAAGGNSAGGTRVTPTGGTFQPKFSSRTFTDPNTGLTGWYTPYFDVNGKYSPFYYTWNRTTDAFTRNGNITVNYPGATTQSTYWFPDTTTASSVSVTYGMQRIVFNESFTSGSSRYLVMMQLHGAGGIFDSNVSQRTMMTYTVNSSDYAQMSFHSNVVIPATPKNIVWLNDARTTLGIVTHSYFYVYNFSSNAWTQTASLNYQFGAVGRDSLGRVWAVDNGPLNGGRLHLLSGSLPTTVSVVPASNSYNYSGNTISTSYSVDAYDLTGARLAANVTLSVIGSSIRFVDNTSTQVSTISVTTSNVATTTVNAAVVSAGSSTISTSVTL